MERSAKAPGLTLSMQQLLILSILALSAMCACSFADSKASSKPRRYEEGPLRRDEFRGSVDAKSPADAATLTRVMIQYTFNARSIDGRVESQITSIKVFSVFLPSASWWRPDAGDELLDHEQGHFDVAEIAARKLQLAVRRRLAANSTIIGVGTDRTSADKNLAEKIRKLMQASNAQAVQENKEYDRATRHGNRLRAQRDWRRVQQATLLRLEKMLQEFDAKPKDS